MKQLFICLLITSAAFGQTSRDTFRVPSMLPDTIHAVFMVSRAPGQPYVQVRGAVIQGKYYYQTVALINKGKWFPFRKNWHVYSWKPCFE